MRIKEALIFAVCLTSLLYAHRVACQGARAAINERFSFKLGSPLLGPINCIAVEGGRVVWAGTEQGLLKIDGEDRRLFNPSNSDIRDGHINRIVIDQAGNKWMGSYKYGLMRLSPDGVFEHYPFEGGFLHLISSIGIDSGGRLWVSTMNQGVFRLEGKSLKPIYQEKGSKLPSNTVYSLAFEGESLWAGTNRGLCLIDAKGRMSVNKELESVQRLLQLHNGQFFACGLSPTGPHLWRLLDKSWENAPPLCEPLPALKNIVEGESYIWLSTDEGLLRFDGKSCKRFDARHGLGGQAVTCAAIDGKGQVWVGTAKGQILCLEKQGAVQPKVMDEEGIEVGAEVVLKKLHFEQGTDVLLDAEMAKEEILGFMEVWREDPSLFWEVSGHTDNRGSAIENWKLSRARARAVARIIEKMGVPKHQIIPKWAGETRPIAPNDTEENRQKNRRVSIKLTAEGTDSSE